MAENDNIASAADAATEVAADATQAAPDSAQTGSAPDAPPAGGVAHEADYTLAPPDGVPLAEEGLAAFADFAKEQGLSKEAAQALLGKLAPAMHERQAKMVEQIRADWRSQVKADKEIGGEKLNENLAVAKKALDKFGTPELTAMLNETGLGDHPDLVRTFYRIGKAISEDGFVASSAGAAGNAKDPRRLYAASGMNP